MFSFNQLFDPRKSILIEMLDLQEAAGSLRDQEPVTATANIIRGPFAAAVDPFPLFKMSADGIDQSRFIEHETVAAGPPALTADDRKTAATVVEGEVGSDGHVASPISQDAEAATEVMKQAQTEADRLLARAHEQASRMEVEGYQAGYRSGQQTACQDITQQFATVLASLQQAAQDTVELRHAVLRQAEADIVTLAFDLARKVIQREIQTNREILHTTLQRALSHLIDRDDVIVNVNPSDLQQARDLQQELMQSLGNLRHLTFVANEHVGAGGCVVQSAFGEIDARLEAQIDELEQHFRDLHSVGADDVATR